MKTEQGFTLLEIMIALAILGIALTIILQQFSTGLRTVMVTRDYTTALIHAREKLEEFCLAKKLSEKEESGEFEDGYKWRVVISPYEEEEEQKESGTEFLLLSMYTVTSMVSWEAGNREKKIELATVKLVPKEGWK
jgi:general secretion pathway protein I